MATDLQEDLRGDEDQQGAERVEKSRERQSKQDADDKDYVGAGTDQAEAFANDPANASGSKASKSSKKPAEDGGGSSRFARVAQIAQTAASFASGNKKKLGAGGGIMALIAVMLFGLSALLPLKLESMMKNIYSDHMGPMEHMVERRATRVFIKYAVRGSLASNGSIVATGRPLGDLYKTWRVQKFEANLKTKYNLSIEKSPVKGKAIRVTQGTTNIDVSSESELTQYFDDLNHAQAREKVKFIIKDETKWYQGIKRWHLRKWMYNAYGIRRWKFFDNKKGKDAQTELDTKLRESAMGEYKNRLGKALGCILGDAAQCPDKKGSTDTANPDSVDKSQILQDETAKAAETASAGEISQTLTKSLTARVTAMLAKAIPVVGWVDLAARFDDFIWNGRATAIATDLRKAQYASSFASWISMADQIKEGKAVSGDEVNAAMTKLEGNEKSATSVRIYNGQATGGVAPKDSDLFGNLYIKSIELGYTLNPQVAATHKVLHIWLITVSKVIDAIGSIVSWVLHLIPWLSSFEDFIAKIFMKGVELILAPVVTGNETGVGLTNAIDIGAEVTSQDATQNVMGGHELTVAEANGLEVATNAGLQADQRQLGLFARLFSVDNPKSLTNRLAIMSPSSLGQAFNQAGNQFVAAISAPFKGMGQYALSAVGMPAFAGGSVPHYGLDVYGYTEAELGTDIDEAGLNAAAVRGAVRDPRVKRADGSVNISYMIPADCDADPANPTVPNICKLDLATIQALKTPYTDEDDASIAADPAPAAGTPTTPGTGPAPTGDIQALATQILGMSSVTFWTNNGVNTRDVLVALSQGKPAYTTCANANGAHPAVNPNILKFIIEAGQQTHVMVNALTDKCHTNGSNHYSGQAVDLDLNSGPLSILNPIASKYGGVKNSETTHHHYDFIK